MIKSHTRPITYLITPGDATPDNFEEKQADILNAVRAASANGISLIQIREKQISTRSLFSLVSAAADITRESGTRLLVNDRVDVAISAGADGVHLTTRSLPVGVIRQTFGNELLVAVSTHTLQEALDAREGGADLVVFGPLFASPDKAEPVGLERLSEVCASLSDVPVVGLGGVNGENYHSVLEAGGAGFAAIRFLNDPDVIRSIAHRL
ncbi:MAG: thiamine phosphate synthase [Acidobacteriota bacterium]